MMMSDYNRLLLDYYSNYFPIPHVLQIIFTLNYCVIFICLSCSKNCFNHIILFMLTSIFLIELGLVKFRFPLTNLVAMMKNYLLALHDAQVLQIFLLNFHAKNHAEVRVENGAYFIFDQFFQNYWNLLDRLC